MYWELYQGANSNILLKIKKTMEWDRKFYSFIFIFFTMTAKDKFSLLKTTMHACGMVNREVESHVNNTSLSGKLGILSVK